MIKNLFLKDNKKQLSALTYGWPSYFKIQGCQPPPPKKNPKKTNELIPVQKLNKKF